ncbi:MAG: acetamidase/formamidase family protein [Halobacteriota archaeon]
MAERIPPSGHVDPQEDVIYEFTPEMDARWTVTPGTSVTIHTIDSLIGEVESEGDLLHEVPEEVNAATGPIAIDGASPGDVLRVRIDDVHVPEAIGRVTVLPGFGLHHDHDALEAPRTRIADVGDASVRFEGLDFPLEPMIGTIGVAPREGSYTTIVPHDHGGNLDTTDVRAGSTIYFPVFQPGALLGLGDSKAVMGDGEVSGTGAEVATDVDVTLDLIEDPPIALDRPLIETAEAWKTVASGESLEEACRLANEDLIRLVEREHGLDFTDAYMATSLAADLEISQVVDPLVTVRNAIPKASLSNPFAG